MIQFTDDFLNFIQILFFFRVWPICKIHLSGSVGKYPNELGLPHHWCYDLMLIYNVYTNYTVIFQVHFEFRLEEEVKIFAKSDVVEDAEAETVETVPDLPFPLSTGV